MNMQNVFANGNGHPYYIGYCAFEEGKPYNEYACSEFKNGWTDAAFDSFQQAKQRKNKGETK